MTSYRPGDQGALPFDPDDPPEAPPPGANPMTWRMAYRIYTEHRPGPDGTCVAGTCAAAGTVWPCPPAGLAGAGFADAVGAAAGPDAGRAPGRHAGRAPTAA